MKKQDAMLLFITAVLVSTVGESTRFCADEIDSAFMEIFENKKEAQTIEARKARTKAYQEAKTFAREAKDRAEAAEMALTIAIGFAESVVFEESKILKNTKLNG